MSPRFYSQQPIQSPQATLVGSEAQHLAKVMRANVGDTATVFDGSGVEFYCRITRIDRSQIDLDVISQSTVDRELPFTLTLGVALPKGDRQRWLVEKAVELGVTRIVPLVTRRGVAQPVKQALSRLERYVIEASKQCGRNRLLTIASPSPLQAYLQTTDPDELRLIAHPVDAAALGEIERQDRNVSLAIGPEGGFDDGELQQAAGLGWAPVHLGPRILRVETAAAALTAFFSLTVQGHDA